MKKNSYKWKNDTKVGHPKTEHWISSFLVLQDLVSLLLLLFVFNTDLVLSLISSSFFNVQMVQTLILILFRLNGSV